VRIVDGPFANFSGQVDEVNPERGYDARDVVTISDAPRPWNGIPAGGKGLSMAKQGYGSV